MRISDWSSDVCSSDLPQLWRSPDSARPAADDRWRSESGVLRIIPPLREGVIKPRSQNCPSRAYVRIVRNRSPACCLRFPRQCHRSEEHTSELQSLMRISYAVFCLKKKKQKKHQHSYIKSYQM